jgi:spore coat protein CotH
MNHALPIRYHIAVLAVLGVVVRVLAAEPQSERPADSTDALFDPGHFLHVEIQLDPKDWHALRISHWLRKGSTGDVLPENAYPYFKADVTVDGRKFRSVGVRKKGYIGTAVSTRPSLKIKLDEYVKNQRFAGLDMLTFNNNYQDESQARQWLAYYVMRKAGVPAPRCNLARVVVNGENLGVYTHIESVRKPYIERQFKNTKGDLYEGFGGDFTTNRFHRFIHKWGKEKDGASLRKLLDLLQQTAPASVTHIGRVLDLDSFITFWAATSLVNHWDSFPGNQNNVYIYRNPASERLHFMPWGADTSFAQSWQPYSVIGGAFLCRQLWKRPEVQARYRKEMQRLLNEVWDEKMLLGELEKIADLSRMHWTVDASEVAAAHTQIRMFIEKRRQEVQAELDAPPREFREWKPSPATPAAPAKMMEVSGTFSTLMQGPITDELSSVVRFDTGTASVEFTVDGTKRRPFERYGVVAHQKQVWAWWKDHPGIGMVAADPSGKLEWRISLMLDPHQARSGVTNLSVDTIAVKAALIQGPPGATNRQWRVPRNVTGTVDLEAFDLKIGGKVSGSFRLNTTAFDP